MTLPEGMFWEGDGLTLRFTRDTPPDCLPLLERVIWGTTGPRYRMPEAREHMSGLPDAAWVVMEERGALIGVYMLVERMRTWGAETVPTIYRSALAIHPDHLHRKLGATLVRETRAFVLRHLSRGVVFGFIEEANARSLVISERVGYRSAGRLEAVMPSWRRPRDVDGVRPMRAQEHPEVLSRLAARYEGHAFADFAHSSRPEHTWVLERGGAVVASLMAAPQRWEIQDLGAGRWLKRLLPLVPLYGRMVDPDDFRFVWAQHVEYDAPTDAWSLLEGVLRAHGLHVAMLVGDPSSPVWHGFRGARHLGVLAPIRNHLQVMTAQVGVPTHAGPLVYTLGGI